MTTDRLAFRGRTVKGPGGIVRFIPDPPQRTPAQKRSGWTGDEEPLWDILQRNLAKIPAPVPNVVGVLCECGCLLRNDRELCPACVIPWCRQQEERGRRLQTERANRRGYWTRKREAA